MQTKSHQQRRRDDQRSPAWAKLLAVFLLGLVIVLTILGLAHGQTPAALTAACAHGKAEYIDGMWWITCYDDVLFQCGFES